MEIDRRLSLQIETDLFALFDAALTLAKRCRPAEGLYIECLYALTGENRACLMNRDRVLDSKDAGL